MKKRRKILSRYLPMLLISVLLGGSFWSWNARSLGGDAMPMPFGLGLSVVLSGSMEPALSVGDLLLIREADSYEVGDIVVYQSGIVAVVHRLISLDGETAVTKGDANNAADEAIPVQDIKGKVSARIPGAGKIIRLLHTPTAKLAILAAAVLLLLLSYRKEDEAAEAETDRIRQEIEELKAEMEKGHGEKKA